jgi:hypothetical protein
MTPMRDDPSSVSAAQPDLDEHPRGTLAIVLIFAVLFAVGWFAFYLVGFMERGAPHH